MQTMNFCSIKRTNNQMSKNCERFEIKPLCSVGASYESFFFGSSIVTDRAPNVFTMSWGCWKHVFGIPGARPMFLKAELHKESKNGFKTINFRPPSVMIFSKNCFQGKKIIKKIGCFVDFWIFTAIYMNNLDQF